jgi:hypothetical protein
MFKVRGFWHLYHDGFHKIETLVLPGVDSAM